MSKLTHEDIEPIWRTSDRGYTTKFRLRMESSTEDENVYQTYWMEEHEYLDEDYIYWNTKYNTIKITHKSKTLFLGKIKNKKELVKVLQMTGVIKDE